MKAGTSFGVGRARSVRAERFRPVPTPTRHVDPCQLRPGLPFPRIPPLQPPLPDPTQRTAHLPAPALTPTHV